MPKKIQRRVGLAFALAILVLAVIGVAAQRGLRDMEAATDAARRSSDLLAALDATVQAVTDAESAQRGYLLTADARQINRFRLAVAASEHRGRALKSVVRESYRAQVDAVLAVAARRVAVLDEGVREHATGGLPAALAVVRRPLGRALMDTLRAQVARLRVLEVSALDDSGGAARVEVDRVGMIVLLGLFVAIAIAGLATILVSHDERANARALLDLERTRDAAEAANHAKSDFLARMSHELRTPLNAIIGFAGILLRNRRSVLNTQELAYLSRIQTSGTHLLEIIGDILDLSRVESGRIDLSVEDTDLAALVRETSTSFADQLTGRDVTLAIALPGSLQPVSTDPVKLRRVLANLISNAIKFTEHGRVLVRIVTDQGGLRPWRLDVIDSGIGVAPSRRAAIFGAFDQGENGTTRRFGGAGLGLAISRSLCQRLGLGLTVVSEDGVGSTFSILFDSAARGPSAHQPPIGGEIIHRAVDAAPRNAEREHASSPSAPTVLIVVEHVEARLLLAQYVDDAGIVAIAAEGAEEGLQLALEHCPDVIVVDVEMHGMDGWEVIQRLKTHRSTADLPVLVVSAAGMERSPKFSSAVQILEQPVTQEMLQLAIRAQLAPSAGRVLVVDGGDTVTALLAAPIAGSSGITVDVARSEDAALQQLGEAPPDVLIVHVDTERDGLALFDHLSAHPTMASLPTIAVLSCELSSSERRTLESRVLGVLDVATSSSEGVRRLLRRALPGAGAVPVDSDA
ncbi:MAG: response regulator [Gemmatimonadaceae bacterium]|nr:response regulator [Gemmatimonadaceae bacterium]